MLTNRHKAILELLDSVEEGEYIPSIDIASILHYSYQGVQADVGELQTAYGNGEIDRCPVGINTVGYKIGTTEEIDKYTSKKIAQLFKRLKKYNNMRKMAGLDGQLSFDGESIVIMDTGRKE